MEYQNSRFDIDNLPNRLTIFRMLLIPFVLGPLFFQSSDLFNEGIKENLGIISGLTFILASITDFFDGHIARKRNLVTLFGSFLDPIADKFLTVSALIMLQALDKIHVIFVIILVLREIYMSSLRLLAMSEGLQIPVNQLGKWKTATQMVGIPALMFPPYLFNVIPGHLIGEICILIASLLSLYSSIVYTAGALRKLRPLRTKVKKQKTTGK